MQDARLGEFHAPRVTRMVVVVAGEMQRPMHHQMRQMMCRTAPAAAASRRITPSASSISGAGWV